MKLIKDIKRTINTLAVKKLSVAETLPELKDKTVLITGANKGVGLEIFKELNKNSCKTAVFVRNKEKFLDAIKDEQTNEYIVLEGDVRNFDQCAAAVSQTIEKFSKIDVLINNAGIFVEKPLEEVKKDELDAIIETNLTGVIQMSMAVAKYIKQQKSGTIVNIGSKISHNTQVAPNKSLYAATKYGVEGFSFALNRELKEYGARCICVMPGTISTFLSTKSGNYMAPQRVAQIIEQIIKFEDVDFEGLVFKSIHQDI